jgi:ankyrin repeat protein
MKMRARRNRGQRKDSPARLSALDGAAESELHHVAWAGDVLQAAVLIAKGASVNQVDSAGETALHGAAACGHTEMVRLLVSAGAQVNIQAHATRDFTPLHWAAGWGNIRTVQLLVEAGAMVSAKDAAGKSPKEIALEHKNQDIAAYLSTVA